MFGLKRTPAARIRHVVELSNLAFLLFRIIDDLAVHNRQNYPCFINLSRIHLINIAIKHDKVRQFASSDCPFDFLSELRVSRAYSESANRFIYPDLLLGNPPLRMFPVQSLASNGCLDSFEWI